MASNNFSEEGLGFQALLDNIQPTELSSNSSVTETSDALDQSNKKKRKQVKKACLNCRISHAACGDERPCKRCKAHHLELSCVDIERKNSKALKQRRLQETSSRSDTSDSTAPNFSQYIHQNLLGLGTIGTQRDLNDLIQRTLNTTPQNTVPFVSPSSTSPSLLSNFLEPSSSSHSSTTTDLVSQIVNSNFKLQQQILQQLNVVSSQDSSPFSVQSLIKNEKSPVDTTSDFSRNQSSFFNYSQLSSSNIAKNGADTSTSRHQDESNLDPVSLLLQDLDWNPPSTSQQQSTMSDSSSFDLFSMPPFSDSRIEDREKRKTIKEESPDTTTSSTNYTYFPTLATGVVTMTSNRSSNGCVVLPYFEEEENLVHLSMIWYPDGSLYSCNEQALEIFNLEKEYIPSFHSQQMYHTNTSGNSMENSISNATSSVHKLDSSKKRVYLEDFLDGTNTVEYDFLQQQIHLVFKGKSPSFETDSLMFRVPHQFVNTGNSSTKYVGFCSFFGVKSNWSHLKYITSNLFIKKQM